MRLLPPDAVAYRRTAELSESTIPAALRRNHATKAGVWCRIVVVAGALRYRILGPAPEEHVLSPGHPGVVEPAVPHEIAPAGEVRFYVEFFRRQPKEPAKP